MSYNPDQEFIISKMTRAEIAEWLNDYYDDNVDDSDKEECLHLQPNDSRLTTEFCQWFVSKMAEIDNEDFDEGERAGWYNVLASDIWDVCVNIVDFHVCE